MYVCMCVNVCVEVYMCIPVCVFVCVCVFLCEKCTEGGRGSVGVFVFASSLFCVHPAAILIFLLNLVECVIKWLRSNNMCSHSEGQDVLLFATTPKSLSFCVSVSVSGLCP